MERESKGPYQKDDGKWYFLDAETYYNDREFGPYETKIEASDACAAHWEWEYQMSRG